MTFADRLEELRKAATPGPWKAEPRRLVLDEQRGPLMSYLYGNRASTEGLCVSLASERVADHQIVAFLVNNADAILELVRWSTVLVGHAPGDDLEAELGVVEALAKLNGEQT